MKSADTLKVFYFLDRTAKSYTKEREAGNPSPHQPPNCMHHSLDPPKNHQFGIWSHFSRMKRKWEKELTNDEIMKQTNLGSLPRTYAQWNDVRFENAKEPPIFTLSPLFSRSLFPSLLVSSLKDHYQQSRNKMTLWGWWLYDYASVGTVLKPTLSSCMAWRRVRFLRQVEPPMVRLSHDNNSSTLLMNCLAVEVVSSRFATPSCEVVTPDALGISDVIAMRKEKSLSGF